MTEPITTSAGPVTLDDVRTVLADTSPNSTNAGAVRRLLGRGSLTTLQKHLDTLRAEAAGPALDVGDGSPIPPVPADLVAAVWSSAWAQAQARTHGALAVAQARIEALGVDLGLARDDAASAQAEADAAAEDLKAVHVHYREAGETARLSEISRNETIEGLHLELGRVQQLRAQEVKIAESALEAERAERARDARDAQNAMALVQAQSEASLATMRSEVDRLVSQLADLRAALSRPMVADPDQGNN